MSTADRLLPSELDAPLAPPNIDVQSSRSVLIAGAGLAGLSAAWYLADAGYRVTIVEKREVAGGKASSWQDADGDWLESGLHVFFGAYRNLLNFLRDTRLEDNLIWTPHVLTFSQPGGRLSPLVFPSWLPAPLHGLVAIARSRGVLSLPDKIRTSVGLLWPILASPTYIDGQESRTYEEWHLSHALGRRSLGDFFDTMALALNFSTSKQISAKLLLTVLSHFGKETDASRVAFLKGSPQVRLFEPLLGQLQRRGVQVRLGAKVSRIAYDPISDKVTGFELDDGATATADIYVSAMPAHNLWKVLPGTLRGRAPFGGVRHLHGVPVMTVQLYFDRPVTGVRNLLFSSRTHISVYAELGQICPDFDHRRPTTDDGRCTIDGRPSSVVGGRTMVELVVAPAAQWFRLTDEDVIGRVIEEFAALHPAARKARLLKATVVRIPQSVYAAGPGMDRHRPDQQTSVSNFFLCGDFTKQEYLASMEGAVLSGKKVALKIARAVPATSIAFKESEPILGA